MNSHDHGNSGLHSLRSANLTYHSLDDTGSVISIRPEVFRSQMEMLAASAVKVVPLADIFLHPNAVALTFDDGFANFTEHAAPVLEHFGFPATVFVVSGYCGGANNWPTQPAGVPRLPLMSWSALRDLPPNIAFGAHTVAHPDLDAVDDAAMAREILQSRTDIEQNTGRSIESFAYPYGNVNPRSAAFVRRHFRVACGTQLGFVETEADPAVLPRLDVYYLKSAMWFRNPLGTPNAVYIHFRARLREARRRTVRG